mmetsp:Transcript_15860/g.37471  ORF Transcript_15860/g.37471 Transcript_15860/m.37471 type:complete len:293 (-) Transcript_15860:100-978(-)
MKWLMPKHSSSSVIRSADLSTRQRAYTYPSSSSRSRSISNSSNNMTMNHQHQHQHQHPIYHSAEDDSSTFSVGKMECDHVPHHGPQQDKRRTVTFDESRNEIYDNNTRESRSTTQDDDIVTAWYKPHELEQIHRDNRSSLKAILRAALLATKGQPSFLSTLEQLYESCSNPSHNETNSTILQQRIAQFWKDHPDWQGLEQQASRVLLRDRAARRAELMDTVFLLSFHHPDRDDDDDDHTNDDDEKNDNAEGSDHDNIDRDPTLSEACQDISRGSRIWAQSMAAATTVSLLPQ